MATATEPKASVKRVAVQAALEAEARAAGAAGQVIRDQVEELARLGARQMLLAALEDEVNAYLRRGWYERCVAAGPAADNAPPGACRPGVHGRGVHGGDVHGPGFRGYRNGTTPRRLTLGSGTVPLEVPRVRDIPSGQAPFDTNHKTMNVLDKLPKAE